MRLVAIDPFAIRLRPFDLYHCEDVELFTDHLMVFVCWLDASDALYAVEQPIVQNYFCIHGKTIWGVGMIVGHDKNGGILDAPTMSEEDITKAISFGTADAPFQKAEGCHRWEE
jgi:hypothetical protein